MNNIWHGIENAYDALGPVWFAVVLAAGTITLLLWVTP